MSRSDRDQRGGHPRRHPPLLDCECCPDLSARDREGTRSVVRRRSVAEQRSTAVADDCDVAGPISEALSQPHVFLAGRCIRCNVHVFDAGLYDDTLDCPGKADDEPIGYTTETGGKPACTHRLDDVERLYV